LRGCDWLAPGRGMPEQSYDYKLNYVKYFNLAAGTGTERAIAMLFWDKEEIWGGVGPPDYKATRGERAQRGLTSPQCLLGGVLL